jgi:rSAM/selenodomain-associated transferase 1
MSRPRGRRRRVRTPGLREDGGTAPETGGRDLSAPTEMCGALVIMAKAPREGFVKTRLTGACSPREVVQLYECMLQDTLALARSLPSVHAAVMCPSEDVADISARLQPGAHVVGQDGRGLAAALASSFRHFVQAGFRRVIAIDSDSPHLPPAIVESAFALLDTNDLVVGPTEDGGYYLVGASETHPQLFDAAPLGTSSAYDALRANARALGLSVGVTEVWYDVDVPADLSQLAAELRLAPERAPRTAAFLESLVRISTRDEKRAL